MLSTKGHMAISVPAVPTAPVASKRKSRRDSSSSAPSWGSVLSAIFNSSQHPVCRTVPSLDVLEKFGIGAITNCFPLKAQKAAWQNPRRHDKEPPTYKTDSERCKGDFMRLALYQPDIPQNAGNILRLAACFGVGVDVIEPCGFHLDDRHLRRAGMDYLELAEISRHASWGDFAGQAGGRLIVLSTKGETVFTEFAFRSDDILLFGRESTGLPDAVHRLAAARLRIPLRPGLRSLNVASAASIALAEALRQTGGFP
jgi:tRNA (cytidine/uridine-2'-O-)-methyltransferase